MIGIWIAILLNIGVLPHPSDPYYECMLIVRPRMYILCAPGGNVIDQDKRKWTGYCNRGDRCPNP